MSHACGNLSDIGRREILSRGGISKESAQLRGLPGGFALASVVFNLASARAALKRKERTAAMLS